MSARRTTHTRYQYAVILTLCIIFIYAVIVYKSSSTVVWTVKELKGSPDLSHLPPSSDVGELLYGKVGASDPKLVSFIRNRWLVGPSERDRSIRHPEKEHYSEQGQSEYVDKLLKGRNNGFFIEAGMAEGDVYSNTLFFEKSRNWTGLLVEANPENYQKLLDRNRHAYSINGCLSPDNTTALKNFRLNTYLGGVVSNIDKYHKQWMDRVKENRYTYVQCFPLYSIILAIGRKHVDYLSLDVEGAEVDILKTIPFHDLTIDVISVEYAVNDGKGVKAEASLEKLTKIKKVILGSGLYKKMTVIPENTPDHKALDVVFARKDIL